MATYKLTDSAAAIDSKLSQINVTSGLSQLFSTASSSIVVVSTAASTADSKAVVASSAASAVTGTASTAVSTASAAGSTATSAANAVAGKMNTWASVINVDDHCIGPINLDEDTIRIFEVRNRCNTASYDSVNGPVYILFEIQAPDPSKDTPYGGTMHSQEATYTSKIPEYGKFTDWSTMQYGDGTATDDSAGTSINMQNRTGNEAQWNNIYFTGKKSGSTKRLMDIAYNGSIGLGGMWVIPDWGNDIAIQSHQSGLVLAKAYNTISLNSNVFRKAGTTGFQHYGANGENCGQVVIEDGVLYIRCASGSGKAVGDAITWGNTVSVSPTEVGFFGQSGVQAAYVAAATDAGTTQTLANALRTMAIDIGLMAAS